MSTSAYLNPQFNGKLAVMATAQSCDYHACCFDKNDEDRLMSIWFVSRHPGAVEWARMQRIAVDHWMPHLDVEEVAACDTVIGTLPVQLAAQVCGRGARYLNLSLNLPFEQRGRELSAEELLAANARLEEFVIFRRENT